MKRILLDQGVPATGAVILRAEGWDVVHVREIGMSKAADLEFLAYAANESRVVITLDRDFPQILALSAAVRPSIVLVRQQRLRAAEFSALLTSIWRDYEHSLDQGCVVKVGSRGTRVRLLPLR
jgi:predicted nuclease of predicted toxin-antitoxin system